MVTLLYLLALLVTSLLAFGPWGIFVMPMAIWFQALLHFCLTTKWDWPFLFRFFTCILIIGVLFVLLLLPALNATSPRARVPSSESMNQLQQITQALLSYEADHGRFPPLYVTDDDGNKLFSWRVLLLPYLDQNHVYEQFHFDEPWDSPHNRQLLSAVGSFTSPRVEQNSDDAGLTNYVAIVGPQTIWDPPTRVGMREVTDGASSTFAIVEVGAEDIHWSEPRDISSEEVVELLTQWPSKLLVHRTPGYFYTLVYPRNSHIVSFLDGHIDSFLPLAEVGEASQRITIAGGEDVAEQPREISDPSDRPAVETIVHWHHVGGFTVWLALVLLPVIPAIRRHVWQPEEKLHKND